jgi:hypothetical protein
MSPVETAIHDKSIRDAGISTGQWATADVMMMCASPKVGDSSRNRQSTKDGRYGSGDRKLMHDPIPP